MTELIDRNYLLLQIWDNVKRRNLKYEPFFEMLETQLEGADVTTVNFAVEKIAIIVNLWASGDKKKELKRRAFDLCIKFF